MLIRWLLPKPEQLAATAAKAAAEFVNSSSRGEAIQKFVERTKELGKAQMLITRWLSDGKFDPEEVKELEACLLPLAKTVYDRVVGEG